jgi:hypothetical protein
MVWKIPQTEEQWSECLSAYLDGEMNEDGRAELEIHLLTDPERSRQLEEYRRACALLQGWGVDVPEPNPAFLRQLKKLEREKREPFWKRYLFPNMNWVPFSAGVAVGACALLFAQSSIVFSKPPGVSANDVPGKSQPVYNIFISQNQAENLMGEVTASGLTAQMKTQLRNNQWEAAAATYQLLLKNYPDTKAFLEVKNAPAVQTFVQKYVKTRSI